MHTLMNTAEKRSTPSCSEMAHLSLQRIQDLEVLFTKHTAYFMVIVSTCFHLAREKTIKPTRSAKGAWVLVPADDWKDWRFHPYCLLHLRLKRGLYRKLLLCEIR